MSKAVVLLSGGLDSATVAALALASGHEVIALSVYYGQRNARELQSAKKIAHKLEIKEHFVVDINLAQWGGSTLTNHEKFNSTDLTHSTIIANDYVPGRNTVFISVALSLAEAKEANLIYLGFNAADTYYPDTQQSYLESFENLASLYSRNGIEGTAPKLVAPLIKYDKVSIINQALQLGVPIVDTWSCYSGKEEPCGICNACRIRDFGLIKAGRSDLATAKGRDFYVQDTQRATSIFWRFMLR
ncbi:7-cyano-7-deazaguanine synthase QueC [Aetokthonos hydrillicola Thurmond2011]|jgi:7-cyano-7-deazaguanine synthase|uniref:7-cyano-7-deazaguanine synthase n=1 Tax=Aetokthonos hydrillicola Thurmond2011 TaxID=2712845 RepID=A0AAP5MDJ4_9CYAN|nr:7-cyano-7-deazaguanine synthase QueC [Aetokthonos hydrillicola]MBO3459544.1 7-cyano-7-deazaguanine synthase QueC [Aetokthonos hydrillicola CCALA 1050]MBW4590293.1 7-cyano-7-deazaguanine synthase QueC [Aetokthonos hydrillicola CCALA 1050]MDR9899419.1 7-cyano-7-deazaguanine synthase QueC [Aetokthonos hydrillicola Thurmond2011]